jgi:hypothetical protein
MKRDKLKSLVSAIFAVMLVLTSTVSIAAAAIADSEEQFEAPSDQDALTWNYYMTSYQQVYKYHDSNRFINIMTASPMLLAEFRAILFG